jgi:hypothetical protein
VFVAILGALATLFVGIVGAWFASIAGAKRGAQTAFNLAQEQQRRDLEEKRASALKAAQYALYSQWNALEGVRRQHLEPHRNNPQRFLVMPKYYVPEVPMLVDFDSIVFITGGKEANLLQEIYLAQQAYHSCTHSIDIVRVEYDKFQNNPRLIRGPLDTKTGERAITGDIGETFMLKEAIDLMYATIDRTIPIISEVNEKIGAFSKQYFPKYGRLSFSPIDNTGSPPKE